MQWSRNSTPRTFRLRFGGVLPSRQRTSGRFPNWRQEFSHWRSNISKRTGLLTFLPIPFSSELDRFARCRAWKTLKGFSETLASDTARRRRFLEAFLPLLNRDNAHFVMHPMSLLVRRGFAVVYRQNSQCSTIFLGHRGSTFGLPLGLLVGTRSCEYRLARLSAESDSGPGVQSNL